MTWIQVDHIETAFADADTAGGGHLVQLPNEAAAGHVAQAGDVDVLFIGSTTIIEGTVGSPIPPAGFTIPQFFVNNQGGYALYRICVGGEAPQVTIKTSGNFNTQVSFERWRSGSGAAYETSAQAHIDLNGNTSSPGVTTPALAGTGRLSVAGSLNTDDVALLPTTPTWSAGYTPLGTAVIGAAASPQAAYGQYGYNNNAGPAAESPVASWVNQMRNRYIFVMVFSPGAGVTNVTVQDTSGAAEAAGTAGTVTIGTTIQDTSGAAVAAGSAGTLALDVTITDTSGAAVAAPSASTVTTDQVVHDTMVMPVAQYALGCLQTEAAKVADPPANYHLRPGATFVAMVDSSRDECCEGIGWVRTGPQYPTDNFPQQRGESSNIAPAYMAIQIELGIERCLPTVGPTGDGDMPVASQWLAITQAVADDQAALRRAVCCLMAKYGNDAVVAGQIAPLENEGNCTGSAVVVTIRVPFCEC